MAYEIPGQMITLPSGSTLLAARQFTFVSVNTSGQAVSPVDGASVIGVLQNKPTAVGQGASIMISGVSKIVAAGSTLASGDLCATSTAGRATARGGGEYAIGRIIAGSSGSTGRVLTVNLESLGSTAA